MQSSPFSWFISFIFLQVVAYHMCQADNNITCMVPEFVHSIAAHMARAPQLHAYKELLLHGKCKQ